MHIVIDLVILFSTILLGFPLPLIHGGASTWASFFPTFPSFTTVGFRGLKSLTLLAIRSSSGRVPLGLGGNRERLVGVANSMLGRIRGGMGARRVGLRDRRGHLRDLLSAVACSGAS
jgi:hypothetical protein